MKTLILSISFSLFSNLFSQDRQDCQLIHQHITQVKSSIEEYNVSKLNNLPNRIFPETIVEMPINVIESFKGFRNLQHIIKKEKEVSLKCLYVLDEIDKAIFFKASQVLNENDYITFVASASEYVASGTVNNRQLKWALMPSSKHLQKMWRLKQPEETQKLIERIKTNAKDAEITLYLNEMQKRNLSE